MFQSILKVLFIVSVPAFVFFVYFFKNFEFGEQVLQTAPGASPVKEEVKIKEKEEIKTSSKVVLPVPYVSEAPDGIWSGPWKNACEEAVIAMAEYFYEGQKEVSIAEDKIFLSKLFEFQDKKYGSNANSDSERNLEIIHANTNFEGVLKVNPTIEDIKNEILAGRPVLGMHRGFDLHNKNIPFLATGSSYHTTIVIGFDDEKKHFITNDPGDEIDGKGYEYDYDIFMNSLHDYNFETSLADGKPVVIFTKIKD
jgi:hypothetical protein